MTSDAPAAFVGVSGGVVSLSGLGRFPGLVFSSLVALGLPWVLGAVWSPMDSKFFGGGLFRWCAVLRSTVNLCFYFKVRVLGLEVNGVGT